MVVVPMMFVVLEGDVLLRLMALLAGILKEVDFLHSLSDILRFED
jgi:hypothetical protein